jgi:aflatoxin B1 aldehyde reductase
MLKAPVTNIIFGTMTLGYCGVALRWLIHHSQLNAEHNDGVIIGASSLEQLRHNLTAVTEGPLPTDVLTAIDDAALKAQPKWPPYFNGV